MGSEWRAHNTLRALYAGSTVRVNASSKYCSRSEALFPSPKRRQSPDEEITT